METAMGIVKATAKEKWLEIEAVKGKVKLTARATAKFEGTATAKVKVTDHQRA